MEVIDIIMFAGLVSMIASLVFMYRCAKEKSRQKTEKIIEIFVSIERIVRYHNKCLDKLLEVMVKENENEPFLENRVTRLQDITKELEEKREELDRSIKSLTDIQTELMKSADSLTEHSRWLREQITHKEMTVHDLEQRIDSLKKIMEGLEIALDNVPVKELHYLAKPVFSMGITPSICDRLKARGILYIGDLIPLSENYLAEIWGVGQVTLERIKDRMKENGVWFGMDVIRVNDRWFRRKQQPTED